MRWTLLAVLAATAVAGPWARAQTPSAAVLESRLLAAKSLKCTFTQLATGTWTADGATQGNTKAVTLAVQFTEINADESTARMLSNFGTYDMIVRVMAGNMHFIQPLRSGALYTTTVFAKESRPGKFKAVHSRHEYVEIVLPGFTARPEQYYGECEVAQ